MSHALRHEPELYGLKLLNEGWVDTSDLLMAIRREPAFENITLNDLENVIHSSKKKRHEIKGDKIRALYGHSTSVKLEYKASKPPETLYHGTTEDSIDKIMQEGLKPMNRQYVHLSAVKKEAIQVAKRRSKNIILLEVQARKAYSKGTEFYYSDSVWLCKYLHFDYINPLI